MTKTVKEFLIRVRADIREGLDQLKSLNSELKNVSDTATENSESVLTVGDSIKFLTRAAVGYLSLQMVKNMVLEADAYHVLQQRIKSATKATGDYAQTSSRLNQISNETGTRLETTVSLFQSLARSAPALQASNKEMLTLTTLVQQLGVIGGSSQAAMNAGLLQFSQGLSAGTFRAEELNSILENLPEVAVRIERGLGLMPGTLKSAVLEGKVLSKDVMTALLKQAPEIAGEFDQLESSVGRTATALGNAWGKFLAGADDATRASKVVGRVMERLTLFLDPESETAMDRLIRGLNTINATINANQAMGQNNGLLPYLENQRQQILAEIDLLREIERRPTPTRPGGSDPQPSPEKLAEEKKRAAEISKITDALAEQAATLGLTNEQIALYKLAQLGASDADTERAKAAADLIRQFELDKDAARERLKQIEEEKKLRAEAAREAEHIVRANMSLNELQTAQLKRLNELYAAGHLSFTEYQRAIRNTMKAYDDLRDKADEVGQELERITQGSADAFTDAWVDAVETGKLSFSDFIGYVRRELLRLYIYQNLTKPLFGALGLPGFETASVNHTGGLAGAGLQRMIPLGSSYGAPRYHKGGIAGLAPNEVNSVLEVGEEILPVTDPRHRSNLRSGALDVVVRMENSGAAKEASNGTATFDGKSLVISVVTDDLRSDGAIARAIDARQHGPRR